VITVRQSSLPSRGKWKRSWNSHSHWRIPIVIWDRESSHRRVHRGPNYVW